MNRPDPDRHVCPACHLPAIPIMYGSPSERGQALLHLGRVAGGGCVVDANMPTLACPRQHRWRPGSPPAVVPDGDDPVLTGARRYLAGDLAGAARAYREAASGLAAEDALPIRQGLATVLYRDGREQESETEYRAAWAAAGRPITRGPIPTVEEFEAIVARHHRPRE